MSPSRPWPFRYRQAEWYVAQQDRDAVTILAGPLRTLREARRRVFQLAKAAGDSAPWPSLDSFARDGYPSFYALHTGDDVYYAGLGGALFDQGTDWADALRRYATS